MCIFATSCSLWHEPNTTHVASKDQHVMRVVMRVMRVVMRGIEQRSRLSAGQHAGGVDDSSWEGVVVTCISV